LNPFIFRREDIRGVVGQDWNYQEVILIGSAFGTFLRRRGCSQCFVGRDNRLSSDKITSSLISGLTSTGITVYDLGLSTTPMIYWTRYFYGFGEYGSVCVTGSHNPPEYNGLKLCFKDTTTIVGDDIQEIRRLCESKDFLESSGQVVKRDIIKDYFSSLLFSLSKTSLLKVRKLKVVVDCANAVSGMFAPEFYKELGYEVVGLHSRLDGTYPNHLPDPSLGPNMAELVSWVRNEKADLGIAFDGDVDRINVVDETGYVIWADGILALLARDFLKKRVSEPILFNTQCSPGLEEDVIAHGGRPVWVPTGHARVSDYLKRYHANLAGEYKGHIYLADTYYGIDDAIYVGARLMQLLSSTSISLSKLLKDVPVYKATGEITLPCADEVKFIVTKKISESFKAKYYVQDLEGDLRIKFDSDMRDTWGMVRSSDTMPKIEIYVWAKSEDDLSRARDIMVDEVNKYL